jgi:hypothetical protein
MSPIFQIGPDDNINELDLELAYQATLTVDQRFEMMIKSGEVLLRTLIDKGFKKPYEITLQSE